ncbi:CcdB family protein [Thioalkalivibrio sp. XN279]|uniref:CcdB family protein n=1 Tax=Thioalkalivibrio sp. XN279 TaxID=2714953 RepID=UPI00140C116B|nr:CcdB family protein [Thioalkalivibrio sp. XN279]NHA14189.1 plasmid maintenance protein CcdB [Thioalkalivibrio sp. XN279]
MPQFTVYRNPNRTTRDRFPFLLDVQSELLDELDTRLVAPLARLADLPSPPITRLMPVLAVEGADYVMVTPQVAGIPRRLLGEHVADLSSQRHEIRAALDFLLTGF